MAAGLCDRLQNRIRSGDEEHGVPHERRRALPRRGSFRCRCSRMQNLSIGNSLSLSHPTSATEKPVANNKVLIRNTPAWRPIPPRYPPPHGGQKAVYRSRLLLPAICIQAEAAQATGTKANLLSDETPQLLSDCISRSDPDLAWRRPGPTSGHKGWDATARSPEHKLTLTQI
jgi:hypothetical protein